jgi:hypothetical protein
MSIPFVCHTRILGAGGHSIGPLQEVFCGLEICFMFAGWSRGGKKAKEKKKENHFVLCLINFV